MVAYPLSRLMHFCVGPGSQPCRRARPRSHRSEAQGAVRFHAVSKFHPTCGVSMKVLEPTCVIQSGFRAGWRSLSGVAAVATALFALGSPAVTRAAAETEVRV